MKNIKMIKNILVAVDLSKYSSTVVLEAKTLAKKLGVPLTYVYVFQNTEMLKSQFNIHKSEIEKYYSNLLHLKYGISAESKVLIKFGRTYKEIIAVAKKLEAPMIIAGHYGSNPLARLFLGSTAEKLALESPYPVWIHRGDNVIIPKKILIPCDLTERSHRAVVQVDPLLKVFSASSELFHVEPEPIPLLDYQSYVAFAKEIKKDELQKIKRFRKRHPNLKIAISTGGVVNSIQKRSKKFDMIAITPKESLRSKPFFGSVTSKLVRSGDVPILIAP